MSVSSNPEELLREYVRDGVVRVPQIFSVEDLQIARRQIENYSREIAPQLPATEVTFEADGKSVRNLWRMEQHSPFFAELARRPENVALVRLLLGGDPVLLGVETFNKPALIGSRVPPHQDNAYFCQSPPDVLTVWIAIDRVTEANGPVFYARGSHKAGLLPHKPSGVKGNSMGLVGEFHSADTIAGLLEPGDALIHHCETVHYSEPNCTSSPRCGLLLVYRAAHTQTDPSLKTAYERARSA